ncbi:hypothetical protein M9980_04360 [Sphingomonas donggukensis]|uniref:Uncharacterized protein n=1 Tax=Sphingomonas donggukensis TaxID=2949093 RepID=A0ABY4TVT8_9SPHN|nr:hypothetical protein [Sphingomonas donggukensis]URW76458.1 hypothetical protein M9980_04360 [Sphingomonas donggukensis]
MTKQAELVARLYKRLYDKPLIRNDLRGELVEEMVAIALEPEWVSCGDDWGASDLRHVESGLRMQVKQSAALQTWHRDGFSKSSPRFSIKQKTGSWVASTWTAHIWRNAEIFVFGWHPLSDKDCDHRDPEQWEFYVVEESALPSTQSISLATLKKLSSATTIDRLRSTVEYMMPPKTIPPAAPLVP